MNPVSWICILAVLTSLSTGCRTAQPAAGLSASPDLVLTSPGHRIVYQRGVDGNGLIPVGGRSPWPGAELEARLAPVKASPTGSRWQSLGRADAAGHFSQTIRASAGWYRLEVRLKDTPAARTIIERVGVGEVFIVVGHSVAQGGETNLAGEADDRVNTIAWPAVAAERRRDYERTADPSLLPALLGTPFTNDVVPAPFGHGTYFWAAFAGQIARREDVPVLLLNAAFGGTSLEHWARSARGEMFEHSFVRAAIRMPYINLHHALRQYAAHTGVRAILADQGQNDWPEPDGDTVFANYRAFVNQARADFGFTNLAVVVNRQTPPGGQVQIRAAQERMLRDVPAAFPGPDYDTLAPADRYDGIHLSASGLSRAAQLWADALTPEFFRQVPPCLPREQP